MNRHLYRTSQTSSPVRTVPKPTARKVKVLQSGDGGPNNVQDRLTCTICGWSGNPITVSPGGNFPTTYQVTGSTYVWSSPDQPLSVIDKAVVPIPQPSVSCGFCGGTLLMSGAKGVGQ